MHNTTGILFSFGALVFWGFGDFFIQRVTRQTSRAKSLFYNTLFGAIVMLPFVWSQLHTLIDVPRIFWELLALSVFILPVAIMNFEALRRGKLSVIMPVIGLELPLTVLYAIVLAHERPSPLQFTLMGVVFVGIVLTVTAFGGDEHFKKMHVERGAILALLTAFGLATTNYFIAATSRESSPLLALWFTHVALAVMVGAYFLVRRELGSVMAGLKKFPRSILAMCLFDNVGWLSYANAATRIPISIAVTISEGFVALASILGIVVNKEKLKPHQFLGAAIAISGILVLAYVT